MLVAPVLYRSACLPRLSNRQAHTSNQILGRRAQLRALCERSTLPCLHAQLSVLHHLAPWKLDRFIKVLTLVHFKIQSALA